MEFSEVVAKRVSIRSFSDKPVPKDILTDIVKEAQRTPSWVNSQPWKVYIATGETLKRIERQHLLLDRMGSMEPAEWPVMSRLNWHPRTQENMQDWLVDVTSAEGGQDFGALQPLQFKAPVYVYLTIPKQAPIYAAYDLGAFSQTLMLAAQNKGVDSLAAYELIRFPSSVKTEMGIPDDEVLAMGVALGYRDKHALNQFVSSRVPVENILEIKE